MSIHVSLSGNLTEFIFVAKLRHTGELPELFVRVQIFASWLFNSLPDLSSGRSSHEATPLPPARGSANAGANHLFSFIRSKIRINCNDRADSCRHSSRHLIVLSWRDATAPSFFSVYSQLNARARARGISNPCNRLIMAGDTDIYCAISR